jgi:hypothetical protein
MSLCPAFLIIGLMLGAILMYLVTSKRNRKWYYMTIGGVRGRDLESSVRHYLEDGWDMFTTPSEIMAGHVDVHFRKFM